jgi:hypothetical protein
MELATVATVHISEHVYDGFSFTRRLKDNHVASASIGEQIAPSFAQPYVQHVDKPAGLDLIKAAIKKILAIG